MSAPPFEAGVEPAPGYEVIDHLSRGRRLDVYDAWSWERGARVIVKMLRPELRDDERSRQKLRGEGELLQELTHPHIVRGYETLEAPEVVVVMETLRGRTLAHLIDEGPGPLDLPDLSQLGLQLGSAIRYLHANGILHLDLKPSNVVAESGQAKLIDMSVARAPGPVPAGVGTWCYMAPEQARGTVAGPAADVWGLGAVLFEAATGQAAFDDPEHEQSTGSQEPGWETDDGSSWEERFSGPYPQLQRRAVRADQLRELPLPVADLLAACLEPEPKRRPPVAELLWLLEGVGDLPGEERRWTRARFGDGSGAARLKTATRTVDG